jgi:hypothetical protein
MDSEKTKTFEMQDVEQISVNVAGFRVPDPDDSKAEFLAVRVTYSGMSGYLFPWDEKYEKDSSGPMEDVRQDIIQSLKDLLARVESNTHLDAPDNVH